MPAKQVSGRSSLWLKEAAWTAGRQRQGPSRHHLAPRECELIGSSLPDERLGTVAQRLDEGLRSPSQTTLARDAAIGCKDGSPQGGYTKHSS
jgi:hypothetical protein